MHDSILEFLRLNLSAADVCGKSVLEVGSYDVNGSPRTAIMPLLPASYIGLDSEPGPGVDVVGDATDLPSRFGDGSFGVVVSTETLEHATEWRKMVSSIKRVVRPGGLLIVTTRSPGFMYHAYPVDAWRYTIDHFRAIFRDMEMLNLVSDCAAPGVFLKARKPHEFVEADIERLEVAMSPKRTDCPLLLTATIEPKNVPLLVLKDPSERLHDYVASLVSWTRHGPFRSIVICENSGLGGVFEKLVPWAAQHGTDLEVLCFNDNQGAQVRGKGYGEGKIIQYALANSRTLKGAGSFYKATGRLYIENAFDVVWSCEGKPTVVSVAMGRDRPHAGKAVADTRFFKVESALFRERFDSAHLEVDDINELYLEHVYGRIFASLVPPVHQFPLEPVFVGRCASTNLWHRGFYAEILNAANALIEKLGLKV